MLMQLRDDGTLSLDDEIRKYQPKFHIQNPFSKSARGITFRQLATHLSGLHLRN